MNLFLSVGAMKAGTTWLYSLLESNPDLYFTPEKEIHFLNHHYINDNVLREEFRLMQAQNRLSGSKTKHIGVYKMLSRWYGMYLEKPSDFTWYDRVFSLNRTKKYNCDFSNLSCHLSANHWVDLKNRYDNIKIIYVLRDPVKRLWSHLKFHHEFAGKSLDFNSWSEKEFKEFISRKFIWDNCTYSKYIDEMKTVFNENEFMTLYFEDLTTDSTVELYRIEDFLDIRHHEYANEKLSKKVNVSKSIPAPDNFLKASMSLLGPEYRKMADSGVRIHERWSHF